MAPHWARRKLDPPVASICSAGHQKSPWPPESRNSSIVVNSSVLPQQVLFLLQQASGQTRVSKIKYFSNVDKRTGNISSLLFFLSKFHGKRTQKIFSNNERLVIFTGKEFIYGSYIASQKISMKHSLNILLYTAANNKLSLDIKTDILRTKNISISLEWKLL